VNQLRVYNENRKAGEKEKVVIAVDSLKGSLTSLEACNAVREGILRVVNTAEQVFRLIAAVKQ